ncbi:unnamed protein product [Adineta ricciae]|uniref:Uncharacterized protein n=1 Tax=Adineta ricciae TaxID=249248 RepID=A0A815Z5U5_ADIRI|nr:unnamed protein product [Adineta ricciae]CAF1578528.1 unnamed protein product [Adineta ricciae]
MTTSAQPEEYQMKTSLDLTTDDTANHFPLLLDSKMEKTKLFHAGGFIMFKKLAAYSLALGILVAGSALFVVQHLPTQSTKLAVGTYTEKNELSPSSTPRNSFAKQSSVVQDQLMNIPASVQKNGIAPIDSLAENVPMIESEVPTFIQLDKTNPYVPEHTTSLPTIAEGPNLSVLEFPTVYHPQQETIVTMPIIEDPYNISNYGTYRVTIYSEDSQHVIADTLLNVVPRIELCVPKQFIVRDSVNNIIKDGIVTLKSGEEHAVVFTGRTDQNGSVNLPDTITDGLYEVEIYSQNNSKLQRLNFSMIAFQNRRQMKANSFIGRTDLKPNEIEIVLKWDADPHDLDSHLYASDGTHIYFSTKNAENMSLDYDITTGYGPETIRFTVKSNLKYIYAVHRYAGNSILAQSKAELMFSINTNQTHICRAGKQDKLINGEKHRIPHTARPQANFWVVFLLDGSTNEIKFFENAFENHNDFGTNIIPTKYFSL